MLRRTHSCRYANENFNEWKQFSEIHQHKVSLKLFKLFFSFEMGADDRAVLLRKHS
jgi:hypothetical protein